MYSQTAEPNKRKTKKQQQLEDLFEAQIELATKDKQTGLKTELLKNEKDTNMMRVKMHKGMEKQKEYLELIEDLKSYSHSLHAKLQRYRSKVISLRNQNMSLKSSIRSVSSSSSSSSSSFLSGRESMELDSASDADMNKFLARKNEFLQIIDQQNQRIQALEFVPDLLSSVCCPSDAVILRKKIQSRNRFKNLKPN